MKNKTLSFIYDFASVLLTALLAVSIIFTFFFKISVVNGQSMENTLKHGDAVIINAVNNKLKYGDVVVISQPNGFEKILIKRIIAIEGQTIEFDSYTGKVFVDGVALDEPYIKESMIMGETLTQRYTVPEGMLFVMGDNRNVSGDSRDPRVGFIDERYVVGKVVYKMWDSHLFGKELQNV